MLKIFALPADQDPMPLSRRLWRAGIAHRILPAASNPEHDFWLLKPQDLVQAQQVIMAWQQGEPESPPLQAARRSGWAVEIEQRWVTLTLMGLALIVSLSYEYLWGAAVFLSVSYTPMGVQMGQIVSLPLSATLESGQWWRLISPIFIHFGWMHLVFNLLWMWVLGEAIERHQGHFRLVLLVLIAALVSNTAQFMVNQSSQFGGLSGVIYAYLGYTWLLSRRLPRSGLEIPSALVAFMLGWMLLGMTPWAQSFGLNMANEAHLGGLIAGLLFALLPLRFHRNAS
ncbi:rhomboid family intramembrane serine protease [Marinospirillum sp.]|uniref:rhomboid family intramembrane serine protease n=1 Tax=Marinospirillum sp. TaxID=2183934 RepID=UPI003A8A53A2